MPIAKAVIGAGYGDEGKGLITDYLCAKHGADVVVRFNGGAQAGHTVTTPAGERHVFGHIGAGTFTGASTFLSKYFVVNPQAFLKEIDEFKYLVRSHPDIYVDESAIITTPYDMLINQMAEASRGVFRHGSCGLGFGETIERSTYDDFAVRYGDLADPVDLKEKIEKIRTEWYPKRCKELGLRTADGADIVDNENVVKNFVYDSTEMFEICEMANSFFLQDANLIVFEGAQGLMLDQDYGAMPHVTRSNTGMKNIEEIMYDLDIDDIEVTYVTRCYTTRHGAGPLANGLLEKPYPGIVDKTNVSNKYQGSLRFAHLDINVLKAAIKHDISTVGKVHRHINPLYKLAVTCLDQTDEVKVYDGGRLLTFRSDSYGDPADAIYSRVGLTGGLIKSFGPTRMTIQERD